MSKGFAVGFFCGMMFVRILQIVAEDKRYRAEWDAFSAGAAAQRALADNGES